MKFQGVEIADLSDDELIDAALYTQQAATKALDHYHLMAGCLEIIGAEMSKRDSLGAPGDATIN